MAGFRNWSGLYTTAADQVGSDTGILKVRGSSIAGIAPVNVKGFPPVVTGQVGLFQRL
jgi:hypothetical protein